MFGPAKLRLNIQWSNLGQEKGTPYCTGDATVELDICISGCSERREAMIAISP